MRKTAIVVAIATFAIVLGCVIRTEHKIDAHITLDIRHIADQAEGVLDFIEGKTETLPGMEDAPSEGVVRLNRFLRSLDPMPMAHADTLKVTTSPRITEIAVKMRERHGAIQALKRQGCLGETNRGYVELRDCDAITEANQRNEAQKTVAAENEDRKALYNEIARLNREAPNVNVGTVEAIYALERLQRASAGEIAQLPPAGTNFELVKRSDLGRKLGDKCQPGAWVAIP